MAAQQGDLGRCQRCGTEVQFLRHRGSGRLAPIERKPNWQGSFLIDPQTLTYWTHYEPRSPLIDFYENHYACCRGTRFDRQPQDMG